jgi:hypothetical protein
MRISEATVTRLIQDWKRQQQPQPSQVSPQPQAQQQSPQLPQQHPLPSQSELQPPIPTMQEQEVPPISDSLPSPNSCDNNDSKYREESIVHSTEPPLSICAPPHGGGHEAVNPNSFSIINQSAAPVISSSEPTSLFPSAAKPDLTKSDSKNLGAPLSSFFFVDASAVPASAVVTDADIFRVPAPETETEQVNIHADTETNWRIMVLQVFPSLDLRRDI